MNWVVIPALTIALGWTARLLPESWAAFSLRRSSRWLPLLIGIVTSVFAWWMWGSLNEPSRFHDEAAYILQARILASGHWSAPGPVLPEFFEQFHVLVEPRLMAKYFPGHSLALVPGVWLGLPGLMPVALAGIAGGLLFALARRVAGVAVAAITWSIWLLAPGVSQWRSTYLSQSTSTALWLLCAWLLLRWWEEGRGADLIALGPTSAALALTRPWSAVAFALPTAVAVGAGFQRWRDWRSLAGAFAAGLALLSLVPIWSAATTGNWRQTPYEEYARNYMPWDVLGFEDIEREPIRSLPEDMRKYAAEYRPMRKQHAPAAAPRLLVERIRRSMADLFGGGGWRVGLIAFFFVGVLALPSVGRFALAWPLSLYLVYLWRAHFTSWSAYYTDTLGLIAFAVAAGVCWTLCRAAGKQQLSLEPAGPAVAACAALVAVVLGLGALETGPLRSELARRSAPLRNFRTALEMIPTVERAVVFVRYAPNHNPHRALVENVLDPAAERIVVARDRGEENQKLLEQLAPGRVPYLYDEGSGKLVAMAMNQRRAAELVP